jgi:hypothetical protein
VDELPTFSLDVADGLVPSASSGDPAVELGQLGVKGRGLAAQARQEGTDHAAHSTRPNSAPSSAILAAAISA